MSIDCQIACATTRPPHTTTSSTTSSTTTTGCGSRCTWKAKGDLSGWDKYVNPCLRTCPCAPPSKTPQAACELIATACGSEATSTTTTATCGGSITYICYGGSQGYLSGKCTGGGCYANETCRPLVNTACSGQPDGTTYTRECACRPTTSTSSTTSTTTTNDACAGSWASYFYSTEAGEWISSGGCPAGDCEGSVCRASPPSGGGSDGEFRPRPCGCVTSTTSTTTGLPSCGGSSALYYMTEASELYLIRDCPFEYSGCGIDYQWCTSYYLYDSGGFGPLPSFQEVPCGCYATTTPSP